MELEGELKYMSLTLGGRITRNEKGFDGVLQSKANEIADAMSQIQDTFGAHVGALSNEEML